MNVKIIKLISRIGDMAFVEIGGKLMKAKIDGKAPDSVFLGEIQNNDKKKVIIKVKDEVSLNREVYEVIKNLGIETTKRNAFILRTFMALGLTLDVKKINAVSLSSLPILASVLVFKYADSKSVRNILRLLEAIYSEINKDKISDYDEISFIVNTLVSSKDQDKVFGILNYEEDRGYIFIEMEGSDFRKLILSGEVGGIFFLCVLSRSKNYNLNIEFFGDLRFPSRDEVQNLCKNLENIGIYPINVSISLHGG